MQTPWPNPAVPGYGKAGEPRADQPMGQPMDSGHPVRPVSTGREPGAIVRSARKAEGLTLAELGRRTGYSAAQVSRLERGIAPLQSMVNA